MDLLELDFARVVREHKGTIYTVCYMFSKDEEEVADLFQEILVNMWKGFSGFRGDSSARTWIYRVSLNTCISAERKKKRRGESVPLSMDINLFEDHDEDIKQIRLLQGRISRLGPFDRAIVLLWLENLSYDEIGEIVGISAKNVSVRLFRIKEQLRNMSDEK
jgi:RNA polymerase sigma-70 factor (ECF subfamily)